MQDDNRNALRVARRALADAGFAIDDYSPNFNYLTASLPGAWDGQVVANAGDYISFAAERPKAAVPSDEWDLHEAPKPWSDWVMTDDLHWLSEELDGLSRSGKRRSRLYNRIHNFFANNF
jgi:hypothetical protein